MTEAQRLHDAAQRILAGRKYHAHHTPAPFRGALQTIGRWLQPVVDALGRVTSAIRGNLAAQLLTAAALLILVVLLARSIATRRTVSALAGGSSRARARQEDPDALDAAAADAELRGALELALRLRFRAGLLRLERAGRVAAVDRRPTGALVAAIGSPNFAAVGRRFDAIAYGHEAATPADVDRARATFEELLQESRR